MKALTIWQPWATLIIVGAKPWEWRRWPAPRWLVGQRIVIHAGARKVKPEEVLELRHDLAAGDTSLISEIAESLLTFTPITGYPLASALGTAVVGNAIGAAEWARRHGAPGYDSARIDHHMWGWPLTDIEQWRPFIPARGAQGLWDWREPTMLIRLTPTGARYG